jgi:hypothetical protein
VHFEIAWSEKGKENLTAEADRRERRSTCGRLNSPFSRDEGRLLRRKLLEHVIDVFLKLLNVLVGVG